MPRRARLAVVCDSASRLRIHPVRRRCKTLALAGTALALASPSSATAATIPSDPPAGVAQQARLTADPRPPAAHQAARRPAISSPARQSGRLQAVPLTWKQVLHVASRRTSPTAHQRSLPLADQLTPVGTSGPQIWMPISGSQLANATTIVQQARAMRMGIRSAVIAVATAMQESRLQDLGYGDADSLGLFQQRPSCGRGTAQQIMNPAFAAGTFLAVLQRYQAENPDWAASRSGPAPRASRSLACRSRMRSGKRRPRAW